MRTTHGAGKSGITPSPVLPFPPITISTGPFGLLDVSIMLNLTLNLKIKILFKTIKFSIHDILVTNRKQTSRFRSEKIGKRSQMTAK